jgi:hypothetical protein
MFPGPFLEIRTWLSWRLNVPIVLPIMLGWYGSWIPKRLPIRLVTKEIVPDSREKYQIELRNLYENKNE